MWADRVTPPVSETEIVQRCSYAERCQRDTVVCTLKWNGRFVKFIESIYPEDGDILELDMEERSPFCETGANIWIRASEAEAHLELFQRKARLLRKSPTALLVRKLMIGDGVLSRCANARAQADSQFCWSKSPVQGLAPPGNPDKQILHLSQAIHEIVTPFRRVSACLADHLTCDQNKHVGERVGTAADSCTGRTHQGTALSLPDLAGCLGLSLPEEALWHDLGQLHSLDAEIRTELGSMYWCMLEDWSNLQVQKLMIYTDGSFDRITSAWAFAVLFQDGPETCVLGYRAGRVETDPGSHAFVGSVAHTAQQGEVGAPVWACWWIIRWIRLTGWRGPIEFCWDSTTAGGKASGSFHAADRPGTLARHLQQALETMIAPHEVQRTHVKAHQGEMYNELVDAAAKWTVSQDSTKADEGQLRQALAPTGADAEWMWLYFLPPDPMQSLGPTGIQHKHRKKFNSS